MTTTTALPADLAARLTIVADRLTTADVRVLDMSVSPWSVLVQLASERDVDLAAYAFEDTERDNGEGETYVRVGFFDSVRTVRLFATRTSEAAQIEASLERDNVRAMRRTGGAR